jgi:hypothetical protein
MRTNCPEQRIIAYFAFACATAVSPQTAQGPNIEYRAGATAGFWAKFYVPANAYFNAAVIGARTDARTGL